MRDKVIEPIDYLLAQLGCGCTLMQRRLDNPGLFYLLQQREKGGREVFLCCPTDGRLPVARLIKRTKKREHWPLIEWTRCSSCRADLLVPPPPAEGDEDTMPSAIMKDGVFVRCPRCFHWGTYGYCGTGESYYDVQHRRVACPNCHKDTVIAYDPYTLQPGELLQFTCIECRQLFKKIFRPSPPSAC